MAERTPGKSSVAESGDDSVDRPESGKSRNTIEQELDDALADSFPASDPVAMIIPARGDRQKKARGQ